MQRIHKKRGIELLSSFGVPTISIVELNDITDEQLQEGLSVRLYHTCGNIPDVKLPSIHNCKDLCRISKFIEANKQYGYLVHKTVHPELIASISKRSLEKSLIIFEIFDNFANREMVKYRYCLEEYDGKFYESISIGNTITSGEIVPSLRKLLPYIKKIPYRSYTVEMVDDKSSGILFTDLIVEK